MATLDVQQDLQSPAGALRISSNHPGALAAIPDALTQVLDLAADAATVWALHPSEQDGLRDSAYLDERQELGPHALVDVVEVLRPRQRNVVWIDRYHLVATFPNPQLLARLLGLYVGGEGQLVGYVHHPSVSATFQQATGAMPHNTAPAWDTPILVDQSRFAVRFDARMPGTVALAVATAFRQQAQAALQQLAATVAGW